VFGYCINQPAGECTKASLGYDISVLLELLKLRNGSSEIALAERVPQLTKVFVLHPIAAGKLFPSPDRMVGSIFAFRLLPFI
jgi:hypothetical protein